MRPYNLFIGNRGIGLFRDHRPLLGIVGGLRHFQFSLRLCDFVSKVLGPKLIADNGEWGTYAWSALILGTPGGRIAGGSDEVMRNIVGERVLGLPKDLGIDSKSPFKDLKVGTQKD